MGDYERAMKMMASARKHVTKPTISLFWKPDHEAAAQDFERAAALFKTDNPDLAIHAYEESAEQWAKADSHFMAAKVTEQAAQMAIKLANGQLQASELYAKSAEYFYLGASVERAAESLEKAAKCAEPVNATKAITYYKMCIDHYEQEEKFRVAVDPIKKALGFAIQSNSFVDTIFFFEKLNMVYERVQNDHGVSKTMLSLIIYLVAAGDEVRAKNEFEKGKMGRDELTLAADLLDAMEHNDAELLVKFKKSQLLQFLDQPILRLAIQLHVDASQPHSQPSVPNQEAPLSKFEPLEEDEDIC